MSSSSSNPFWRETKRPRDGSLSSTPKSNEICTIFRPGSVPRNPLVVSQVHSAQTSDGAECKMHNEPRFCRWNPQNSYVLGCLKYYETVCLGADRLSVPYYFTDTDTVLNRVCAWTIESVVRAYAQGGNAEVLKFFGSREGILSLEVLESLITKDSCVDGCPDVAFLFSRLVKVFLSMPTHDASKALSPFTNNASMHIRPDTGRSSPEQRRRACNNSTITIAAAVTTATTNNSDTCNNSGNDEDEDDKGDYDAHLFFPSAELIETFNKESSMLAQARLYADRPEGAMPWRRLPTVFSAILKSFQHRLAGQADNRTGTGDSPHIMPSSFSAQAQSLQQPQPFMLNKKSNRAQYQYQQQQYQQRQQVPTSLFGSICVHMLNVLEKLLFGPGTLTGFLGKPHAVDPLIQVLGMDYAMAGSELYVVHRQLVRTLGSLMVGSAQTVDGIVLLSGHRVIEALVDVLRGDSLPSGVRMEIIQLVAHVLCLSSRLCNNLVYAFKECGGYNVLLDFFLSKECNEGPLEKRRLVKLYCHFLFVMPSPQHTGTAAGSSFDKCVVVENFDGVKLVLDAFVRTTDEDLRTELLTAIQAIFRLQIKSMSRNRGSGWIRRHEANPFIALLSKFDELSLANKKQILPVLDDVIITGGLSPEELQCYCSKLLQDKPPSTIILFMEHFSKLLENGHLLRAQLVKAGILDVLASYFVDPCKIKCASMLEDPEELNAALGLIGNDGYESDETSEDSDGSEAETDAEAPNEHNKEKEEENNDEENAAAAATTHANEASIHRVLHWISASAFKLLAAIIKNNEDIERRLKERSDFKALFTLLSLPDTRECALSIITIIAIQFPEPKDMMMQNIISTINATLDASPSGTEVPLDKLSLWESMFESLNTILETKKEASMAFKKGGGFTCVLSIAKCLRGCQCTECSAAAVSKFLVSAARVLQAALKGSPESSDFIKEKSFFQALTSTLKICFENCQEKDLGELIDIVISMSVQGSWPPPSAHKGCSVEERTLCSECTSSMTLEVPEIIRILLIDLQAIIATKSTAAQLQVLEKVRTLVTFTPDNLEALNSAGVHSTMISTLGEQLTQYAVNGNNNSNERSEDRAVALLLDILMKVLAQNVTGRNVRRLFRELWRTGYSPRVTALLQRLADVPQSPSSSLLLSTKSGIVGLESKVLRSRPWPPRQFTASMWICVKSYGQGGEYLELFSFQSQFQSQVRLGELKASLTPQGTLRFQTSFPSSSSSSLPLMPAGASEGSIGAEMCLQGSVTFAKTHITENVWHHIVIGYKTPNQSPQQMYQEQLAYYKQQQQQQQQQVKITDPRTCTVDLYLDGDFAETATVSLGFPEDTSIKFVVGFAAQRETTPSGSVKVSSMYFFDAAPTSMDVLVMHSLKSGSWGNMRWDFTSMEHCISAAGGPPSEDVKRLLLRPRSVSLERLAQCLILAFVPRKMHIVDSDLLSPGKSVLFHTADGAVVDPERLLPMFLAAAVKSSRNIREVLSEVGGIQVVLYMAGTAATREQQRSAFRLLVSLLADSPANCQQMRAVNGYKLLSRIMSKPSWALDRETLDLTFELVGVARSSQESWAYDKGIVLDTDALQCLVLDWHIWARAPDALKEDLFQGLSSLITVNNASGFNLLRLTQCNIVTELMHIIQRTDTSLRIVHAVISLIKEVIDAGSVCKNDVQAIANFLFATHKVEQQQQQQSQSPTKKVYITQQAHQQQEQEEEEKKKIAQPAQTTNDMPIHFPLLTTGVIGGTLSPQRSRSKSVSVPKSSGLRNQVLSFNKRMSEAEETEANGKTVYMKKDKKKRMRRRKRSGDDALIQKRVLVLEMLHGILSRVNYAAKEIFVEAFPLEVTLAMLQHSTLALRVPLLILLGLCLQNDTQAGKKKSKTQGVMRGIASIVSSSVMPKNEKSLMRMSHETAALMMSSPAIPSTISATASNASNSSAGSNNGNSRNSKSLYLRFVALGGFDLLGMQLQSYSASAELYHTLFRLLVGNNFPKEFKAETNISGNGLSLAVAEAEAALYSGSDSGSGCGNGGNGSGGSSSGGGGGSSSGGSGGLAASKLSGGSGSEGGEFTLARPEVLKTILRIAAGPHAEYKEQHSVIRGLHQICTISEGSMQELIENGLVMGLYGILRARMKARQARTEEKEKERNRDPAFPGETGRVRSGSFGSALDGRRSVLSMFHSFLKAEGADNEPLAPVSTEEEDREEECNSSGSKSGNESEEDDESTEDDEDIMLFMKTIALNSTSEMDTAKNFSGILLCLRSAGFCVEATKVLQERILCDAFRVFTENPGFYSSPCLVAKFAWLAEVALEFIRWDISEDSSSSTTNSNSSSSSVPGREHLRVSGVKQDKAAGMVLILLVNILNKTSPGSQALKEKIGKLLTKVADLTWRLLLYVLRSDKRPSELCAIALSAVGEEYLLTTCPQVGRTYAVMFHATRFYVVPALEDAARNAVKEILRLGPRPNTLLLALMPGHFRLDAEAAEKVCMTVKNVFQLPEECEETLKLHRTVVEEAIGWALQEDRRAREFQAAQEGAIQAASRSQEALRATIAEKCLFIAETARKVQKSAEDRPMLEVSRQRQADAGATHAAWKAIFNGVTHERAVFALDIHGPFHRLGLDPTEDGQRQRLRLRWETSDPPEATLNPPFSALDITNQQWGVPGTLVVQHVSDREYYRIDTYGFCGAGGDSNSSGNDSEKNTSLPTDKYPIVNAVEPLWEDGTAGGHVVRICGTEIHPDDPKLTVYIGGVICDIVGGREDSEVDVRSPPQRVPGFYGVIVAYDGYFRRSSNRYGYLEVSLFKQYLSAKNAIPLDPDKPVPPVPITCGLPKKLAPNPIATTEPEEKCLPATATAGIAPTTTATSLPVRCDEDDDDPATATPAADGESEEENEGEGEGDESGPVVFKERYAVVLDCTWITAFSERPGKVCMNKVGLAFFAEGSVVGVLRKYSWRFEDICEIYGRRHMLRNVAIELFFTTGKTCLFAFADCATRDRFWGIVCKANLPNLLPCDTVEDLRGGLLTNSLTDRWAFGQISNYEYLMRLNVLAGRTFNDLNQYPVFPWVLADYTSEKLDLNDPKSFRDLSKPMGAQNPSRAEKFVAKYEQLAELGETPYHYGTHYSSSGAVLHYMLRLEPYASYHVAFQSGRFDVPDRLFYDMSVAWRLSSGAGLGDVKELIPEFFTLPEMFENRNNFDFGERQDGSRVYGVRLPPWAHNDPREFVRIHRAALESEYVSAHLHEWIDLIFGCKQQSKEALNVFHPYTCEGGIDWDAIKDPVDRLSKQTQVNTWGQTPRKLFSKPHPPRNLRALRQLAASVPVYTAPFAAHFVTRIKLPVSEITLENGVPTFYGAHRLPVHKRSSATVNASQQQQHRKTANSDNNNNISVSSIDVSSTESSSSSSSSSTANTSVNTSASSNTGAMGSDSVTAVSLGDEVVGVPASTPGGTSNGNSATSRVHPKESNIREVYATTVVLGNSGGYESTSNNSYGSSGTNDEFISWGHWDNSMRLVLNDPKVIVVNTCDTITAAATSSTGHCVVCGSAGGTVTAWKRRDPLTPALLGSPTRLYGHTGPVTAVFVSSEYNIIVSGSKDATCIVWDINKMGYVRTLRHNHPIVAVCVSPVTGYIYTIERPNDSESTTLSLWSVNGDQIVYTSTPGANCVQVTANTPGVKSNFVAVGNMNGTITLLTANNLNRVTTFMRDSASTSFIPLSPITAITFS